MWEIISLNYKMCSHLPFPFIKFIANKNGPTTPTHPSRLSCSIVITHCGQCKQESSHISGSPQSPDLSWALAVGGGVLGCSRWLQTMFGIVSIFQMTSDAVYGRKIRFEVVRNTHALIQNSYGHTSNICVYGWRRQTHTHGTLWEL